MLLIPTKTLIAVAAVIWILAGCSVLSVGLGASSSAWNIGMVIGGAITCLFFLVVFINVARKHVLRITGYKEKLSFLLKFFDAKSYVLLAVMIFLGAAVRLSGFVPAHIIAFFYTGLGTALVIAGIYCVVSYVSVCDELIANDAN